MSNYKYVYRTSDVQVVLSWLFDNLTHSCELYGTIHQLISKNISSVVSSDSVISGTSNPTPASTTAASTTAASTTTNNTTNTITNSNGAISALLNETHADKQKKRKISHEWIKNNGIIIISIIENTHTYFYLVVDALSPPTAAFAVRFAPNKRPYGRTTCWSFCINNSDAQKRLTELIVSFLVGNRLCHRPLMLSACNSILLPQIEKQLTKRMMKRTFFELCGIYCLPANKKHIDFASIKKNINVDNCKVVVCCLEEKDADIINSTWKYGKCESTLPLVLSNIQRGGIGVVVDGKLVSWMSTYSSGAIGQLFTLKEYRKRGYAKLVIDSMIKKLREQKKLPFCFIVKGNKASEHLFCNTFGFQCATEVCWAKFSPAPSS